LPPSLAAVVETSPVVRAGAGRAWLAGIIRTDGPAIVRLLWRLLGREQDVLDAFQESFCKLAARTDGDHLANARAYVFRTAANTAIEMLRVRKRRAEHLPAVALEKSSAQADGDAPSVCAEGDRIADLREAIAMLPTHLRNVIMLRDLCRFSYEQVADALGIEPTTARVYRRHGVVQLAALLGGEDQA
jgi:RNA polymerase sigma-70 factor (ECF subfamily)